MASQYDHEPVYDPDQDPEKKRDIRRKYRKHQQVLNGTHMQSMIWLSPLISHILTDKHDTITIEEVTDTLHDTDALFGDGKHTFISPLTPPIIFTASRYPASPP